MGGRILSFFLRILARWLLIFHNSAMETLRKKLFFKSHHMGMKETDHIFGSFSREYLSALSCEELKEYGALLQNSDVDLKNWVLGYETPPPLYNTSLFKKIHSHAQKNKGLIFSSLVSPLGKDVIPD